MTITFTELLKLYPRIAIAGGPGCGKTTLSKQCLGREVISTDSLKHLPWAEQPINLKALTEQYSAFCVEGVQVARALRKGMEVDAVVFLTQPKKELSTRQAGLGKGVVRIMNEWIENKGNVVVVMEKELKR